MAESLSQSTSTTSNSKSNRNTRPNDTDLDFNAQKKIEDMEQELLKLQQENTELKEKLDEAEKQHKLISARLSFLERVTSDADINFYILAFQITPLSSLF